MREIRILYEDECMVVCEKPAGMPSQGDRSSAMDMVSYLKNKQMKEARARNDRSFRAYVGIVHRLDRPVAGVMVYAKTPQAAAALSGQFAEHTTEKTYLAVLTGHLPKKEGILENYLLKDGAANTSAVVPEGTKGAKKAKLAYTVLEEKHGKSLVRIRLFTGRHHQIRVQTAYAGAGIYGDTRYNAEGTARVREEWDETGRELCLYSAQITVIHPKTKKRMDFKCLPAAGQLSIDEWKSLIYYK